jgi:hypothetical protein
MVLNPPMRNPRRATLRANAMTIHPTIAVSIPVPITGDPHVPVRDDRHDFLAWRRWGETHIDIRERRH